VLQDFKERRDREALRGPKAHRVTRELKALKELRALRELKVTRALKALRESLDQQLTRVLLDRPD